jgi:hypothetical protein
MNSKHTLTWFVIAVALFAFIFVYHIFQRSSGPQSLQVLPGLLPSAVTAIQINPNGAPEISAVSTNSSWVLTQPVVYPAQSAAIEGLLGALQKLQAAVRISPAELSQTHDANAQYGFDSPQISLAIQSGDDRREILIGNKTAPGDQVFLRVVGTEGVYVTDTSWLKFIPQSAADWRDPALVGGENNYDSITLTNGAEVITLDYNATNRLWQMNQPLSARANGDYISKALRQLQAARVSQFVTDSSNLDLAAFGLQPAGLDLWLGRGTNVAAAIHFGKSSTNDSSQLYARREGWSAIVTTPKEPLSPWYGAVNDFRDPYLLELTAPVAEVEMIGPGTNHYFIQRKDASTWQIPGETFPVDPDTVQYLIQALTRLRVSEFVKDVVTPAQLPAYGLAAPSRQIILRSAIGDTNTVIAQLLFGSTTTNEVFVRRADENFIYAVAPEDYGRLPEGPAWGFRDRRIWNFTEGDVAKITVHQNGKTLDMIHNGANQWSLAAGSQGVINGPAIEEVAHDLGDMEAVVWWARGVSDPAPLGLKPGNLSITITLKNGQALTTDFGAPLSGQTSLAVVTLDGERWVYIFSPAVYQLVMSYLFAPLTTP